MRGVQQGSTRIVSEPERTPDEGYHFMEDYTCGGNSKERSRANFR